MVEAGWQSCPAPQLFYHCKNILFLIQTYKTWQKLAHYKNDKAIPEIMSLLAKCDLLGVQELTRDKEELLAQDQLQPTGEFDANVPLEPNTETATFSKKARFTFEGMAETIPFHDQQLLDEHFPKQNISAQCYPQK